MLENRWKSCFLGPPGFDEFHWIFYRLWFLWVSMNFFEWLNDFFLLNEWLNEFFLFCFVFWLKNFFLNGWDSLVSWEVNELMFACIECMKRLYIYIDIYIYMWFFVTHPRMCHIVWYCVWICVYLCVFVSNCVNLCHIVSFCVVFCVYLCVFVCILCVFVCICGVVSICTYLRVPNWGTVPRPEWAIY